MEYAIIWLDEFGNLRCNELKTERIFESADPEDYYEIYTYVFPAKAFVVAASVRNDEQSSWTYTDWKCINPYEAYFLSNNNADFSLLPEEAFRPRGSVYQR